MIYLKICSWSFHLVSAGASYINQRILITCLFGESILHVSLFEFISISSTPRVVIMITHYSFAFSGIYQDQCQDLKLYLLLSGNYNECLLLCGLRHASNEEFISSSKFFTNQWNFLFVAKVHLVWSVLFVLFYLDPSLLCIIWTHFLFSILSRWSCAFATKETIGY